MGRKAGSIRVLCIVVVRLGLDDIPVLCLERRVRASWCVQRVRSSIYSEIPLSIVCVRSCFLDGDLPHRAILCAVEVHT